MSFAFSEHEKQRVALASMIGIHLDPIGYTDMAVTIVWAVLIFMQFLAVAYSLHHRRYRPIQNAQPLLMAMLPVASIAWLIGDIVANDIVHPSQQWMRNCIVLVVWLRTTCGQSLVVSSLLLRCISLWFRYRLHRRFTPLISSVFAVLLMAAATIPSIIITLLPTSKTVTFVATIDACIINPQFKTAATLLTWLMFAFLLAAFCMLLMGTKCAHNEHVGVALAWLILGLATGFNTYVMYVKPMYPASLVLRLCLVSANQGSVLAAWWAVMGRAVYNCRFRYHVHLVEWRLASKAAQSAGT
ncbi:hypothetical protein J3B01_003429 [Coemansia erecta]|nr:hypothetical protein J3B01_003429 [Coemansia erecta]